MPVKDTVKVERGPADGKEDKIIEIEGLQGMIADAVAKDHDSKMAEFRTLISDAVTKERKSIFPDSDGKEVETFSKSILDMDYFRKAHMTRHGQRGGLEKMYGNDSNDDFIRKTFRGNKVGPFIKLSPVMEKFATILKCRGNIYDAASMGIDIKEYNAEVREMNEKIIGKALTESDAGSLIPVEYMATVIEYLEAVSPVISQVMRLPMTSASLKVPKLTQSPGSYFGGVTIYHPGEGIEKTTTKPTFETLTYTAYKMAALIHVTDETIADSSINILNYLTTLVNRAFRYQIEHEIIQGLGAGGEMLGIRNDPTVGLVSRTTAGTVKYQDPINLDSEIDEAFPDLTFMMRKATYNAIRLQQDANNRPIHNDSFIDYAGTRQPDQCIGYPVFKTRNCPSIGVKGDVILGDLGFYGWALRSDMVIRQSDIPRFEFDETSLRFVMRMDGKPLTGDAFAQLDGTTS
jgi:HK97 family phage major capsid protein